MTRFSARVRLVVMAQTQQRRASDPAEVGTGAPKMRRRRSARLLGGGAGGLADHLDVRVVGVRLAAHLDVRVVWGRLAFARLSGLGGMGLFGYALLWVFVPQRATAEQEQPGSPKERQQGIGLVVLGAGLTVAGGSISGLLSGWV